MANLQGINQTYFRETCQIGSHLGSASSVIPFWVAPGRAEIISVKLLNGAAISAHTENYGTLAITNELSDASGTAAVASKTTTATAVAALVEWDITASTAANLLVSRGDVLSATWTEAGTGQDLTTANIVIEYALTNTK